MLAKHVTVTKSHNTMSLRGKIRERATPRVFDCQQGYLQAAGTGEFSDGMTGRYAAANALKRCMMESAPLRSAL